MPDAAVNRDEIWADNRLAGRREHAVAIRKMIAENANRSHETGAYVLNLDAPWGSGKTFFLERLSKELSQDHIVVSIDAWRSDYAPDPLLPLIAHLQSALEEHFDRKEKLREALSLMKEKGAEVAGAMLVGAMKGVARKYGKSVIEEIDKAIADGDDDAGADARVIAGETLDAGVDAFFRIGKKAINEYLATEALLIEFKTGLSRVASSVSKVPGKNGPLIIVLDELDRCRPTYAIQFLERVKHIFPIPGIVFIIASDTRQLFASIKKVYGDSFDSETYVQRFFTKTYYLPVPNLLAFVDDQFQQLGISDDDFHHFARTSPTMLAADIFSAFHLTARASARVINILAHAHRERPFKSKLNLAYLLPLAIAFDRSDVEHLRVLSGPSSPREVEKSFNDRGVSLPSYGIPNKFEGKREVHPVAGFIYALLPRLRKPLAGGGYDDSTTSNKYVSDLFNEEFEVEYGGHYHGGQQLFSVYGRYLTLIRSVGELIKDEEEV